MKAQGIDVDGLGGRLASWNARIDALIERTSRRPTRDEALEQALESLRHKRDAVDVQLRLMKQPSPRCRETALRALPLAWRELASTWSSVVHHLERERALRRSSHAAPGPIARPRAAAGP